MIATQDILEFQTGDLAIARLGRPGLSDGQKSEVWDRWRKGDGYSDIGRAIGKHPASVFGILRLQGGYTPAARSRADSHLTLADREEISRGLYAGWSMHEIARQLGRAPSTVSREIDRTGGRYRYPANVADEKTWDRARRPKLCRLAQNGILGRIVANKLAQDWSREQIAGWLKCTYSEDESLHVSHQTIYKSLFVQSRGVLKQELQKYLRTKRPFRQSGNTTTVGPDAVRSSMESRSATGLQKSRIALFRAIGKATSLPVVPISTLLSWWSDSRDLP